MANTDVVWLASYPRSGNTLLRAILWQNFGLRSGSIYPNDLGGRKNLERYAGHLEHTEGRLHFSTSPPLLKTHGLPESIGESSKAIYVYRNGWDATASYHNWLQGKQRLEKIIRGEGWITTWSRHLDLWLAHSHKTEQLLLLRYENLIHSFESTLTRIHEFLGVDQIQLKNRSLPTREAGADGRWVNETSQPIQISGRELKLFMSVNGDMMQRLNYL